MTDELLNITLSSCPSNLRGLREQIRQSVVATGASPELAYKLVLVIDEACANVIRHGYDGQQCGRIKLRMQQEDHELNFILRDYASPVDPECIKPRDLNECRPGGLGINFIDSVMDQWQFRSPLQGEGNVLEMRVKIDGAPGSATSNKE